MQFVLYANKPCVMLSFTESLWPLACMVCNVNSATLFYTTVFFIKCIPQMLYASIVLVSLIDTADGNTTSPQSPPHSLCKPFYMPTSSSPATSHTQNIDLESAPLSMHQSLPPETSLGPSQTQGETKPHITDTSGITGYNPPCIQEEPTSSPPQCLTESSQNLVHELVDTFKPQSQSVTNSTLSNNKATEVLTPPIVPSQEPLSSTVSKDNEVTNLVTCEESVNLFDVDIEEDVTLKETDSPFTNLSTSSQTGALLQEVDMTDSTDAKTTDLDIPDQLQDREQDNSIKNVSINQVDGPPPVSELTFCPSLAEASSSSERSLVHSEFEKNIKNGSASKSAELSEREQTEGESIPSLAQALKELHELLMSSTHAQAGGSSSLSVSHNITRQDTEGLEQNSNTENLSLKPTMESSSSHTATSNESTFAKSEHAAQAEDGTSDVPMLGSQGQENDQTTGLMNIRVEQDTTQTPNTPEGNQVVEKGMGNMSEPGKASPSQGFFEVGEASDSQQGRGDADLSTLGTEPPNTAEPSQQRPLSVTVGSSADHSSLVTVAPSPSTQAYEPASTHFADSTQPSTLTLMGQYPAEHIQRIQAAGFSSHEAAEALEQAEGSVELALLVLLARKITVPT